VALIPCRNGGIHYARTLKRRHTLMKKGDARSARFRHCVMHYNIIEDVCKCTSLISQYMRHALKTLISHHVEKLRRAICVACLVLNDCLSYSGTNRRHMLSEASWSSPGFSSHIVPVEATFSHSHTNAHMDNTLIHKHIQKHKSI
jgi:hypothetical protein